MGSAGHSMVAMPAVREATHVTGRRIISTLIDGLILSIAYNILVEMFGDISNPAAWYWRGAMESVAANVAYGAGVIAYFILMEGYLGQTFGKMVAGVKVIDEKTGEAPGLGAATIRSVLRLIDGQFGYLVAFITVLISDKRQRLGDMAAHTLVVRD